MASPYSSSRSNASRGGSSFPQIKDRGLMESKPVPTLGYIEDGDFEIEDFTQDVGNERHFYRNSPPTIGGYRKPASQTSSRNSSPIQRRFEHAEQNGLSRQSPIISLDLSSPIDDTQLLKDRLTRLQQDKEHLSAQLSHYRVSCESAQTDLAAEKVATSRLQKELREIQHMVSEKEQRLMELKCDIESGRQNEARQTALVQSLRQRVREAEDDAENRDNMASRSDVTILSLRKELQGLQDKLQHVEVSLKHHISAEEEAVNRAAKWETKYGEVRSHIIRALHLDQVEASSMATDALVTKVAEKARENRSIKEKANTLARNLHESNMESKASRETIMRLVSEVGQEKKALDGHKQQMDSVIRERDTLQQRVRELEIEVDNQRRQVTSSQDAWSTVKKELEERDNKLNTMEHALNTSQYTGLATQSKLQEFSRHVGQFVSDVDEDVLTDESAILKRVESIVKRYRNFKAASESLQTQVKNLSDELDSQRNLHRTTLKRATQAESQLKEAQQRVTGLEGELLTSDVERDGLKEDKRKFVSFCEKMARTMKLDEIADDVGFDVTGEALIARGEQLVKLETDALDDRKTTIYNLQRRLKWAKQQIESKDLHQGLLKKKVTSLEELLHDKGRVEVERDENSIKFKKILKHNDKLQRELLDYKQEVTRLKAKLLEISELKITNLEQVKTIEGLEQAINKLARSKQKTKEELVGIKTELGVAESDARETKVKSNMTTQQLSSELQTTKLALEESRLREKQLLNFRQVLARLLGLDVNSLSVPDYDIISRLERLVQAHHAHSITTHSLEGSLQDMEQGFRSGYQDAITILQAPNTLKSLTPRS